MKQEPFIGPSIPPKNEVLAEIDDVLKKESMQKESSAYIITLPDGTTAMAKDKQEEIDLRRQWNENKG